VNSQEKRLKYLKKKLKPIKKTDPSSKGSVFAKSELRVYKLKEAKLKVDELELTIILRRNYAYYIFWMVCIWLSIILIIIFFQGFGIFDLNNSVLITLISSTTANIAAYFLVVIRYLFPKK